MTSIQIMPQTLANQIAAGEVVERPASVVKELIENAIDGNSTQIDITIEEAGLKSIRVLDNGVGIPYDEVASAFKRHATSKLLSNEELFRIRTLGFRGEALPSIASVSELTIETAEEGEKGKSLVLEGGEIVKESSAPSRQGTMIQVDQLFYNTPARLKYVKSIKTELSHISDVVNRLSLAHPEISFRLVHDGTILLKTVGNSDLRQAIAGVYGVTTGKKMRAIKDFNFDFEVSGYVSLPELTRANNKYITMIINGRYIKNYSLNKAVVDGYGSKLMVGRYPIAVINVEMDPLLLDVNVHPTKQQIRISNEKELGQLIKKAIGDRMGDEVRIPSGIDNIYSSTKSKPKKVEQTSIDFQMPKNIEKPSTENRQSFYVEEEYSSQTIEPKNSKIPEQINHEDTVDDSGLEMHVDESPLKTAVKTMQEEESERHFPQMDYIGQMHGTYLFAQNQEGLYIIDQHAAQERIKYEYYRSVIDQSGTVLQDLLVPIVLEYPASDAITIREHSDQLANAGIHLEDFGQNTFLLRSHPSWFEQGQEESTAREMIDFLLAKDELSTARFREATAIMMSCKRSIKANHYLNSNEATSLIGDLAKTKNPYNCPHGRPVLVQLSNNEMEKMFKRIQDPH